MRVRHLYRIHPRDTRVYPAGTWMVALYEPLEPIPDGKGGNLGRVKAVGYDLPTGDLTYVLNGRWERTSYGPQFAVDHATAQIERNRQGIVAFLASDQIKGCGKKIAERIYEAFGDNTLDIIEHTPDRLMEIKGLSKVTAQKIAESCAAINKDTRETLVRLRQLGLTAKLAAAIQAEFKDDTLRVIQKSPYRLCAIKGIGFLKADEIARRLGLDPVREDRICQGLLYVLESKETKGHLCTDFRVLINDAYRLLRGGELTYSHLEQMLDKLILQGDVVVHKQYIYRKQAYDAELRAATELKRLLLSQVDPVGELDYKLTLEEKHLKLVFNDRQREAIKTVLTHPVTIVTGGPGTGKTSIMVAILDIYHKMFPDREIRCCASTGQAARRLSESTGYPASTIHKTLELCAGDEAIADTTRKPLEAGLILCDEFSMVDAYLAPKLFAAVKDGARLCIVGDYNQLPSVGPGAVLRQMIVSGAIPTVRLETVYRNAGLIALNAKRINAQNLALEYDDTFQLTQLSDMDEVIREVQQLYVQEVQRVGIDNVILLSPLRWRTDTGVAAMNARLQEIINPQDGNKQEVQIGDTVIRTGDRIIQMRNTEDVANGEVGYIRKIDTDGSEGILMYCDFGAGRIYPYTEEDCENLDLAYCNTVHKAQGGEYKSVLIICQKAHAYMLNNELLYTAVTRAKEYVHIVGDREAVVTAIRTSGQNRNTNLSELIKALLQGGLVA